jgi:hypothetical protein
MYGRDQELFYLFNLPSMSNIPEPTNFTITFFTAFCLPSFFLGMVGVAPWDKKILNTVLRLHYFLF